MNYTNIIMKPIFKLWFQWILSVRKMKLLRRIRNKHGSIYNVIQSISTVHRTRFHSHKRQVHCFGMSWSSVKCNETFLVKERHCFIINAIFYAGDKNTINEYFSWLLRLSKIILRFFCKNVELFRNSRVTFRFVAKFVLSMGEFNILAILRHLRYFLKRKLGNI